MRVNKRARVRVCLRACLRLADLMEIDSLCSRERPLIAFDPSRLINNNALRNIRVSLLKKYDREGNADFSRALPRSNARGNAGNETAQCKIERAREGEGNFIRSDLRKSRTPVVALASRRAATDFKTYESFFLCLFPVRHHYCQQNRQAKD